jgi:hypothetical protein
VDELSPIFDPEFSDDCNIYVGSKQAGERVMKSVIEFLVWQLRLKVNLEKSAVDRPWSRKFMLRGLSKDRALQSAMNGRGPWWNSGASHMHEAFKF